MAEQRNFSYTNVIAEHGKSRVEFTCPFCGIDVVAYVWSMCAVGKKCTCGVKFSAYGVATKEENKPKKKRG